MKIAVCCPSYKRPRVETLDYLPFCMVFVDNKEEKEYKEANNPKNIVACPDGVQGNLSRVRNYILDYCFENGYDAVAIVDDDMKGMYRFEANGVYGYEKKLIEAKSFKEFLQNNSRVCKEFGYKCWGVNCTDDKGAYRHYTPFSTTSYIGGPFSVHLKNEIRYDEALPLKEDYDITLQHCKKYRGCLRFNMYFYAVKQAENTGGCAVYRTNKKEIEQFNLLQKKWGSKIVKKDTASKREYDFNPRIRVPIKGV